MSIELVISTDRLRISQFQRKDITKEYISWLNDKELMKFSEQRHYYHNLETCEAYLKSFVESNNLFLAINKSNGKLIGSATIYYNMHNNIVDMGIMIGDKTVRGEGFGSEAWKAIADWVIQAMKPRKLTAGCMILNTPMIKLMKSIGMKSDGVKKEHYLINGKPVDIIYMAKFLNSRYNE